MKTCEHGTIIAGHKYCYDCWVNLPCKTCPLPTACIFIFKGCEKKIADSVSQVSLRE